MIFGLSGTNASGKDTLAEYLRDKHNFMFFHTSNFIRSQARKRYGNILRPTLFKVGNELRQEGGAGVLAMMGVKEYHKQKSKYKGLVISSIRTLGEVSSIHSVDGKMIFVDAGREIRYRRIQLRDRDDDRIDYDTFVEQEEAEFFESDNPAKFNILGVKKASDIFIENESSIKKFEKNIRAALDL